MAGHIKILQILTTVLSLAIPPFLLSAVTIVMPSRILLALLSLLGL